MSTKTISMCQGKGSLSHNNREFTAKNIDPFRTADNITFVQQDLGETYHQLFDEAVERYNACQKRSDRKISDYFQHLFSREPSKPVITGANKQKSFYEDLVKSAQKTIQVSALPMPKSQRSVCVNIWRDSKVEIRIFICSMRSCTLIKLLPICTLTISR